MKPIKMSFFKFFVFVFFIFALGFHQSFGQTKVGVRAGGQISNLFSDEVDDQYTKLSAHLGVYYRTKIVGPLYIQPELLYSSKGAGFEYSSFFGFNDPGEVRFNLNYLELPVYAQVNLGPIFAQAGPYLGYLAGANITDRSSNGSVNSVTELNRDDFNTFDYGLSAGAGVRLGPGNLSLRYNYGLRPVAAEGTFARNVLGEAKNSVLMLSFGLEF
jgi:hypothetical protein